MNRLIIALIAFLMLAACTNDPMQWGPDPEPSAEAADLRAEEGSTFRLAPGEFAAVAGGEILVGFRGVRADSRCPANVNCVWSGDAEVVIGTTTEGRSWSWSSLHTGVEPRSLRANGYLIRLVQVEPEARADGAIEADDYRVVIQAERE